MRNTISKGRELTICLKQAVNEWTKTMRGLWFYRWCN